MIRKMLLLILLFPFLVQAQEVRNITELFDSLKTHPVSASDEIRVQQALAGKSMVYSKLYPKIGLFGRYDNASTATGMLPIAPNDLLSMVKDPLVAQPFSENIFRMGATISMPIFVASIFPMAAKAKMMVKSAEDLKNLNLLKNEAVIVGANANLLYIHALDGALQKKKSSILQTREFVSMKVDNGRAPESALLKIDDGINQIGILKNNLALQREAVISVLRSLTGVTVKEPVPMEQLGTYKDGEIIALHPLQKKVEAVRLGYRAEKEKLLPGLMLQGVFSSNSAKSYNNNQKVNNNYTTLGLVLKVPVFAKDQYAQIKKSRLDFEAAQNDLDKTKLELYSQAEQLQSSYKLLENTIQLYSKSIKDKEELLEIAKVGYTSEKLTMEDYLRYEDDVVLEKSKLFKAQAEKWQTLMKLNVIYGNNIEQIVK